MKRNNQAIAFAFALIISISGTTLPAGNVGVTTGDIEVGDIRAGIGDITASVGDISFIVSKIQAASGTCTGDNATCSVSVGTMNALGNPFYLNLATVKPVDAGKIAKDTQVQISLPSKADGIMVYTLTPTEGKYANKKVPFAFKRYAEGKPGQRTAGKELINVFRQNFDKPNGEWYRVGYWEIEPKTGFPKALLVTLKPNGDMVLADPTTQKTLTFELAKDPRKDQ